MKLALFMKHEFNTHVYKGKTYSGLLEVFAKQGTFCHISVLTVIWNC